jgi:cell fate regulator YaaT (PSP1 superfamily)
MQYCVDIKLRSGKRGPYDHGDVKLKLGEKCIIQDKQDLTYGEVITSRRMYYPSVCNCGNKKSPPLPSILRKATDEDQRLISDYNEKEELAFNKCLDKIEQFKLEMSLVDVEYTFDGKKAIFYYTAEDRVDFRELVKDMARSFRLRIEMRQIGARDEASMLGGIGSCGLELCCSSFLKEFATVSIKNAKAQDIALTPSKISGQCGRLKCCLNYESQTYAEARKGLPKVGSEILTPKGKGKVIELLVLKRHVRIYIEEDGAFTVPGNFISYDKEQQKWILESPDFNVS